MDEKDKLLWEYGYVIKKELLEEGKILITNPKYLKRIKFMPLHIIEKDLENMNRK